LLRIETVYILYHVSKDALCSNLLLTFKSCSKKLQRQRRYRDATFHSEIQTAMGVKILDLKTFERLVNQIYGNSTQKTIVRRRNTWRFF